MLLLLNLAIKSQDGSGLLSGDISAALPVSIDRAEGVIKYARGMLEVEEVDGREANLSSEVGQH